MESHSDIIPITTENLSKYGFLCFHQPGKCELENGSWLREIVISVRRNANTVQKFSVPEAYCIELLASKKIVDADNYEINASFTAQETIDLLLQRAGWNQTMADLDSMVDRCRGGIFTASYSIQNEKLSLGSGVSLPISKELGWIGMILVHPEVQRQGIASSVMNSCVEYARLAQHASIIGLDATPQGKQVYDSLGFKDSFTILRSVVDCSSVKSKPEKMIMPFHFHAARLFLEKNNYTERIEIIEIQASLPNGKNFMFLGDDGIQGMVLSRPGRLKPFIGPLIAETPKIAFDLLCFILKEWYISGYKEVFIDIPEMHLENSIFIQNGNRSDSYEDRISVKPVRSFIRMYQLLSKNKAPEISKDLVIEKVQESHDKTAAFMKKEVHEIAPIMYGTGGPEWS